MSEADYNSLLAEVKRWRTVEELSDIIWEVNMNLKFIYISPSVEKLIGFTQKEMMKKSMNDLFTSESVSLIEKTLAEGMEREAADTIREIPPPIEV
ncbi:MAG: PAS domain-containing protein, partial [Candidatus Thorarchaeota archaeon]